MSFVRGPNPIWSEFNLTGAIFDDTYYAFFLENVLPYDPQAVYQDPAGMIPWSDPIQFQPNGCLPNNIYGNSSEVYRIEFRQGPDQTYPLIGNPIENYVFGTGGGSGTITNPLTVAQNMITNPQFADLYIPNPYVYIQGASGTYTVEIGPGWRLVLTGSGSTTITQTSIAGVASSSPPIIPGNPPYYLTIANTGWTTVSLIQTFNNNGAIFANGAIAISFDAFANISTQPLTVGYLPSNGVGSFDLFSGQILTGSLSFYSNIVSPVNPSINNDTGLAANVEISFILPPFASISLTNIQLVGQSSPVVGTLSAPAFQEITYERVVDQEFHSYRDELLAKPTESYLVGWDFPLNPAQWGSTIGPIASGNNSSFYAWDQTIVFQSITSGVTVQRSSFGDGSLQLVASAAGQFAIIQYLDQVQARKLLNNLLSVNVSAIATGSPVPGAVSLWYTTGSLPSTVVSNNSLISTLGSNGVPATFNGTWLPVPNTTSGQNYFPFTAPLQSGTNYPDIPMTGWNLGGIADVDTATYFAIVVGFSTVPLNHDIFFNSVSLCLGNNPTRPDPKTEDQVLRECQYYYEKNYPVGTNPGANFAATMQFPQNIYFDSISSQWRVFPTPFAFNFQTQKNTNPVLTFYAQDGTINDVRAAMYNGSSTTTSANDVPISNWTSLILSTVGIAYAPANTSTLTDTAGGTSSDLFRVGVIQFNYVADSRLGQ